MNGIYICRDLMELLNKGEIREGKIHSVFKNAVNIISNNYLFTLVGMEKPIAPMSIQVKSEDFTGAYLLPDMEVSISPSKINFKDSNLVISLRRAKLWDSTPQFNFIRDKEKNVLFKISKLEELIIKRGRIEGIAPLIFNSAEHLDCMVLNNSYEIPHNKYTLFIYERFINFINAIENYKMDEIKRFRDKIIGFGLGLTPSMDDFLAGLMISMYYATYYYDLDIKKTHDINNEIIKDIKGKTTLISEKMLKYASKGKCNEDLRNFMISIFSPCDETTFIENTLNVINFGETSGSDILCGVYVGFNIVHNESQEVVQNGSQYSS